VRAHALEALGHLLPNAPRDDAVAAAIVAALDDESVEIRFWSIFAAAVILVPEAASTLRRIAADDRSELSGWWPLATEAEWALRVLAGDPDADAVLPTLAPSN
jgi:hypothetical protein